MPQDPTAATPPALAPAPGFARFTVGDFDVVPLHDGVITRDRPPGFVRNADDDAVGEAFAAAGMPRDRLTLTFTPLLLRTPHGLVLIDTGFGAGGPPGTGQLRAHLREAGVRPEDIGTVIISHFHGDHILGLLGADGAPAFAEAELLVPDGEWRCWIDDGAETRLPDGQKDNVALARKVFGSRDDRLRRFAWDEELVPGIRAIDAGGHTPGMTALEITSGDDAMLYAADITNNPLLFARRPDWQVMFDVDGERAVATRRRLLDRAAADQLTLAFYHAPFPTLGTVVRSGAGYEYLPALWRSGN